MQMNVSIHETSRNDGQRTVDYISVRSGRQEHPSEAEREISIVIKYYAAVATAS